VQGLSRNLHTVLRDNPSLSTFVWLFVLMIYQAPVSVSLVAARAYLVPVFKESGRLWMEWPCVNRLEGKASECESPTVLDKALALDYYYQHYIPYVYRSSMLASKVAM
jgi:hypothetical protein